MTKFTRVLLLATCSIAATAAAAGTHSHGTIRGASTVAIFGDAPYGTSPTDTLQMQTSPQFMQALNADPDVSLVLHVGDIHSGKQYCTTKYDYQVRKLWNALQDPMVYTPGDNEWTDCNKAVEGGGTYNAGTGQIDYVKDGKGNLIDYAGGHPLANLNLVRSIFFDHPGRTIGGKKKLVTSQALAFDPAHPEDSQYVENVTFKQSRVRFVTLNLPGGSNNDNDVWYAAPTQTAEQTNEIATRTAANLRWLDAAFDKAEAERAKAVAIIVQADMWDVTQQVAHVAAYNSLLDKISARALAFGRPVLLVNGDSHIYRSDNPMKQGQPCVTEPTSGATATPCPSDGWNLHNTYDVPNFHRIVVHGSTFPLEWLKVGIDPTKHAKGNTEGAFGPFTWTRQIQP